MILSRGEWTVAAMSDKAKRKRIEAIYRKSKRSFPRIADLTAEELQGRLAEGNIVLVDVRSPEEQAVSMIDGAITSAEFEADPDAYEGATVVAYCTIGHRSGLYVQELQGRGWSALNLIGAILAWTHVGGPLVDGDGPTCAVHVWGRRYNLAAEGYEAVW
jgi:rhodanese-related sulfurtransferase